MQLVSYGGVVFELVKTDQFVADPVRSEDRTEVLYMRTTVAFTMIWNPGATSYVGNQGAFAAADGATPGQTNNAIKFHMMKPRLAFQMVAEDGTAILAAPESGFDRDPENGPIPLDCNVTSITARMWRVVWRAIICTRPCGTGSTSDAYSQMPILSNRWSQSQETGMDRLTTVTTRGLTIFDAGLIANLRKSADFWRDRCIPACALDYQRQVVHAQLNTAGTALSWTVVDREMFTSIGATDDPGRGTVERFEAAFSMRSSAPDNGGVPTMNVLARFDGMAWGSKSSSRQAMLGWLARVAIERCAIPNGPINPQTQPMILSATASEKLDAPFVELHIDMQFPPANAGKQGLGTLRADFLGVDLIKTFANDGQNPQMPGGNNTRGTSGALALAAAIRDACAAIPDLPTDAQGAVAGTSDGYLNSTAGPIVAIAADVPDNLLNYSDDATTSGAYTTMTVSTRYKTSQGKMQVPIAGKPPQAGYSYTPGGAGSGGSTTSSTDSPTSEVLTLALPMTEITVTFEAERASTPPIIPTPNVDDANIVLLDEDLQPMAVGLGPDGITPIYRIGGTYSFAAPVARKPGSAFALGVHPFTNFAYSDTLAQVGPETFAHGIIDDPGDSGGGGDA